MVCSCDEKTKAVYNRPEESDEMPPKAAKSAISQNAQDSVLEALLNRLSRCSIQSLTINNYGPLTVIGDTPNVKSTSSHALTPPHLGAAKGGSAVGPQWTWQTANIQVLNNFPGPLYLITIYHIRSATQPKPTWEDFFNINAGQTTDVFSTDFQSGFAADFDSWSVDLQLEEEGPLFKSSVKQCNLREEDKASNGSDVFWVSGETFYINERSGGCTTNVRGGGSDTDPINNFAWVQIINNFGVPITGIDLKHGVATTTRVDERVWTGPIQPNQATSVNPIYYVTGSIGANDLWDISLQVQGESSLRRNATKQKNCPLRTSDNGRTVVITVFNSGYQIQIPSGTYNDTWGPPGSAKVVGDADQGIDREWVEEV